jgi:hypothetical protein
MRPRKISLAECQHREDGAVVGSDIPKNACSVRIVDELGDLHLLLAESSEGPGGYSPTLPRQGRRVSMDELWRYSEIGPGGAREATIHGIAGCQMSATKNIGASARACLLSRARVAAPAGTPMNAAALSAAGEIWALWRRLPRLLFACFPECLGRAFVFFLEELIEIRGIFIPDRIGDFRNTGAGVFHQ